MSSEPSPLEKKCGLSYSLQHLQDVQSTIGLKSREEQSKYADVFCRSYASNKEQIDCLPSVYDTWNTTSVGNLAYLSIHGDLTEEQRVKVEKLLEGYATYSELNNVSSTPSCVIC